ncbi:SDR family oxidoreductase [candidate division KSB1 bacterium]|nr:SDR family oxidoreductase [candidate division KSB1 bacterium]
MSLSVLFIGGTGTISSACVQLAVERGMQLCLLNRGQSERSVPPGVEILRGDIRNKDAVQKALGRRMFDAVVDWIAFTPDHIEMDLELFRGRTSQYVFISSASVYQTPPASLPVTESTPLRNPFWAYSRAKIACEDRLIKAYREENFPITIVRPSHTYDRTLFPMHGQYTILHRMRAGKNVIVHGDGASLWTLTHHRDFAKGFVGLLGLPQAIGETFHITSDEVLTWNQIFEIVAHAAGVQPRIVHIPSEFIAAFDPDWGASLLGDKTHSMIFDNTKIKRFVPDYVATIPFARGAEEIVGWYDANPAKKILDEKTDQLIGKIIAAYESAWPSTQ